ncbi:hypothetical protein [Robertmurraya massiliosenegalensis]|uniref:hypothetical protein n=1 Tax=Robertmurraya massiliosenegalensis TaxID=1287657 RepID=UPI0002E70DB3|nr:hypothetical protein [Robertmurraya massiliosenegalensis]
MKKILLLVGIVGLFLLVGCGDKDVAKSEVEEQAEKMGDSLSNVSDEGSLKELEILSDQKEFEIHGAKVTLNGMYEVTDKKDIAIIQDATKNPPDTAYLILDFNIQRDVPIRIDDVLYLSNKPYYNMWGEETDANQIGNHISSFSSSGKEVISKVAEKYDFIVDLYKEELEQNIGLEGKADRVRLLYEAPLEKFQQTGGYGGYGEDEPLYILMTNINAPSEGASKEEAVVAIEVKKN